MDENKTQEKTRIEKTKRKTADLQHTNLQKQT